MSLISRVIRSLVNGVSQQSPSVRLDNQVSEQVNMIPDISGELTRRSPVILDDIIADGGDWVYGDEDAMLTMTIAEEKVALGIKPDGTVYRFDENFEGTTTITQAASVKTYLTHTDKNDISSVETSDSLIILNRGIEVALETSPADPAADEARSLVWITTAVNLATYKIFRNGNSTPVAHYKAGTTDTPQTIIKGLIDGTITGTAVSTSNMTTTMSGAVESYGQENNTVIVRNTGLEYFEVECDYGDYIHTVAEATKTNTKLMVDPTQLPAKIDTDVLDCLTFGNVTNKDNFLVRVNPSVNEDLTTYYLKYSDDYDAWVEVNNIYIDTIDSTTMPVTITKDTLATITIAHSDFITPLVGDDLSNPPPSIVGSKIKDMLIYNSRLGFASESTLVFSVIDDFYNLYRTTTSDFIISDVVDLELDSSKLGYRSIDNIFTMDNNILINTGLTQSILKMPTNLDLTKAIFAQVSSFDLGNNVPVPIRRSMYFPITTGSFSSIKDFTPDIDTGTGFTDNSVTKHCEKYIRGTIVQSVFSNDMYLVRTNDDAKTIYIQNTYVSEGNILQNAWHKWTFKYDIKFMYSSGNDLKIVFEDAANSNTIYGSLELNPAEILADTVSQIGYLPYLDYQTSDLTLAADLSDVKIVDTTSGKIVASGAANSVQGNVFISSVTLSEIIPKTNDRSGNTTKIGYALLMLRRMAVTLGYSGRFDATVTKTDRTPYVHNFIPELTGDIVVGREPVNTRDARFPINGRSQDITIQISTVDTFTPLQILSVEWQGQLITQGGR